MQFLDCKITLSFSNQKIKDRSETLINKGIYEVKLKFIASLIIHDKQEQERRRPYDEWMGKIDQLAAPMGNDEKIRDVLKPMRDLIELAYGDKKLDAYG